LLGLVLPESSAPLPVASAPETFSLPEVVNTGSDERIELHPEYSKYYKMLRMGVPPEQVRMKMSSEGKNPAALE